MKLYRIYQHTNNKYDTYDSAVVVADSEEKARAIQPDGSPEPTPNREEYKKKKEEWGSWYMDWAPLEDVGVQLLGEATEAFTEPAVITASYNAG